jgi:hypothetical protein
MPVENLPRWSILPNWRQPVIERLECLTAVLTSPTGAEQRYAARWSPRRTFEALMTPSGLVRTLFDVSVSAVGGAPWYLPVWHDGQTLEAGLGANTTVIPADTRHYEFVTGGFVMLWADEFTTDVLEVASVASNSVTVVGGSAAAWPPGTRLFPAVKARLTDMPEMQRMGSRILENAVRFMVETANDFTDEEAEIGFPEYQGFYVLTTRPDEGQDITHGRARLLDEVDGETGLTRRFDQAGKDFTLQKHHWLSVGRKEHADLRALFYELDGRRTPLWLPTYADDFTLVAPVAPASTGIEVARCGFTQYGGPRFSREDVWIHLRDGTNLFRRITGSSFTLDGTEIIQFDSALGVAFDIADVARISFMALCRLDADTMEIEHYANADGASRVALTFRSVPDTRTAAEWEPPPLQNAVPNDEPCGEVACIPVISAVGAPFPITQSEPSGSANLKYPTIEIGEFSTDFFVAYLNGSGDNLRFRYVGTDDSVSAETVVSVSTSDIIGVVSNPLIPMSIGFNTSELEYRLSVSDGGSVYEFDIGTYALDATRTISTGDQIVGLRSGFGSAYRVVMVDPGNGITYATWTVGDPPTAGTTVVSSANVGVVDAKSLPNTFSTWSVVWKDDDTSRLNVNNVVFFSAEIYGPTLVSTSGGNDERHIDNAYAAMFDRHVFAWRRFNGTAPGGSVRMRDLLFDLTGGDPEVEVYPLTGLGVSGYTHLANREPVCGVVLPNRNILLVERRYETVGAQLRAYEVLVLHAPYEASKQSNVVRLSPPGVGPTGDVQRSATIKVLGAADTLADVVVVFEYPVDNDGATQLVAQRFSITTCSQLTEPE